MRPAPVVPASTPPLDLGNLLAPNDGFVDVDLEAPIENGKVAESA